MTEEKKPDGYDSSDYTEGSTESVLHALCDDSSVWYLHSEFNTKTNKYDHEWRRWDLPEIPQEEEQPK